MATPFDDLIPQQQGSQNPFSDLIPSSQSNQPQGWQAQVKPTQTYNGKQSVQRSDGAVWYGPEQGNTGQAGWFDAKGNRAGDAPGQAPRDSWAGRALSALGGAAQVQQSPPGMSGVTPEASQLAATSLSGPAQQAARFYSHVAPNWAGAQEAGNLVNQIQANKQRIISQDPSGAASAASGLGDMGVQAGLAELLGLPEAVSKLGAMGAMGGAGWLPGAFNAARTAAIGGGLFGTQNALTNPSGVDTSNRSFGGLPSYIAGGAKEALNQGSMGTAVGFGLGAIPGVISGAKNLAGAASTGINDALIGARPNLPGEVTTGESVNDIMGSVPKQFEGMTIPEIQRISQGTGEDAGVAKSLVQRLTVAAGNEHGVNLSLHDVSQEPAGRQLEQSLEGDKTVNSFRSTQGSQIRQAVMDQQAKYDGVAQSTPFDSRTPSSASLPTDRPLNPTMDDIHSMTPSIDEAAASGDKGANYVKGLMDGATDNNKIIQASLQGEYWKNRQIGNAIRGSIDASLDRAQTLDPFAFGSKIDPFGTEVPVTHMDPSSALDEIKSRIAEDGKIHPDAERLLSGYQAKLQNPENLSYRGGKGIVSQMESDIEGLKSQGKFGDARDLFLVKNQIDNSADNFARTGLKNDPAGLALMDQDSEWFKKKILPYQDPDGGISKMMNGTDADIATKPLFRDSSPDQFGRIFGLLDSKGQAAVRAEMVGHSGETRMKNFQSMNIPSVATYLENHAEQIGTAFGNDNTMGGLDNLIRNTPRAGYQSNLNQALNAASVGKVVTGKGIISKADAAVGGIVDKGLNAIRVPKLFSPNLADYAGPIAPAPSVPTAPMGIARPTSMAEYEALPSGTPYQSVSGAKGIKP